MGRQQSSEKFEKSVHTQDAKNGNGDSFSAKQLIDEFFYKEKEFESPEELEAFREKLAAELGQIIGEKEVKTALAAFVSEKNKPELHTALDILANDYGFPYDSLGPKEQEGLGLVFVAFNNERRAGNRAELAAFLEEHQKGMLFNRSIEHIGSLQDILRKFGEETDLDTLTDLVRENMKSIEAVSRHISVEDEDSKPYWAALFERYDELLTIKRGGESKILQEAYKIVFAEFSDFIEDDVLSRELQRRIEEGKRVLVEDLIQEIYGRSKEEMEEVKKENRVNVVNAIEQMVEMDDITIEMLEELHLINNRGIVPKSISTMRHTRGVTFGTRIGVEGSDVDVAMTDVADRANLLIDKDIIKGGMNRKKYEVSAAQLHNDMLDIHPFKDRNGSTSLIFMELLMARKGYKPSRERNTDYYSHVRKILGNNPAAIGVVGYGHYRIKYRPGYYEKAFKKGLVSEEKKIKYEDSLRTWVAYRKHTMVEAKKRNKQIKKEQSVLEKNNL